jgi:hypothetical protein
MQWQGKTPQIYGETITKREPYNIQIERTTFFMFIEIGVPCNQERGKLIHCHGILDASQPDKKP